MVLVKYDKQPRGRIIFSCFFFLFLVELYDPSIEIRDVVFITIAKCGKVIGVRESCVMILHKVYLTIINPETRVYLIVDVTTIAQYLRRV